MRFGMTRADPARDAGDLKGTGLKGSSTPEGQPRRSREESPQTEAAAIAAPPQFFVLFIAWLRKLTAGSSLTADDETPGDLLVAASNAGSTTTAEQELQALQAYRARNEVAKRRP